MTNRIRANVRGGSSWAVVVCLLVLTQGSSGQPNSDGFANAPAGAPQLPHLLKGYLVRPSWPVAGVDYYVGPLYGTVLKNPTTISISGVAVDRSRHIVRISASNVTLDGYDFSLNGGWGVQIANGADNVTIQNSHFKVGTNGLHPVNAATVNGGGGKITVRNNNFDGNRVNINNLLNSHGYMLAEYNRFTNIGNDAIYVGAGGATIQYNLFDGFGLANDDAHPDAIQTYFTAIPTFLVQYNTMYAPTISGGFNGGLNAFVRIGDQRNQVVSNPKIAHNTLVLTTSGRMPNAIQLHSDGPNTLFNPNVHDNYIDPTAVGYAIIFFDSAAVNPRTWGNVNLKTGRPILNGPWNSQTANIPANPPTAPIIVAQTAGNSEQLKLTGTGPAGTTIDIYDQGALLGHTIADSHGAWSFTTSQLGGGSHAFSARAADPYSNTSAGSAIFVVNVRPADAR